MRLLDSGSPSGQAARRLLLEMFHAAVQRVSGRRCVAHFLRAHDERMRQYAAINVIAIGKAASSMVRGALDICDQRVRHALLITKDGHVDPELYNDRRVEVVESAHPVPDTRSLAAGLRLLKWVADLAPGELPLFLISGGASSLVEHLRAGVDLAALTELNRRASTEAWPIERLNAARRQLSAIKGGALSTELRRPAVALFISDVPNDDPAVIGSGLLGPAARDSSVGGQTRVPQDHVERHVIARLEDAMHGAAAVASAHGWSVEQATQRFDANVLVIAQRFADELRAGAHRALVWGGESVVTLPANPGRGGRNQHLALLLARHLAADNRVCALAAGTDGTDGTSGDAGALIDGETWRAVERAGFDGDAALEQADSGTVLEETGALVHTGPTGTNVGDLLLGLRYDPRP
ncbi:MAG: DUF4147 domain-containing protein [Pseudomonadales bacterium]|nr:DUF4147 domain-containing protein [Pseudomonadales bacterium]